MAAAFTSMPLSIIFSSSTDPDTSNAAARLMNSSSMKLYRLSLNNCIPSSLPIRIASTSFPSSSSRISFRTVGLNFMISTIGTRLGSSLTVGTSFWAMMPFMLNAMLLRNARCMSCGNRSRIRPMQLGAVDAWIVPKTR